jgi:hypothetical protein
MLAMSPKLEVFLAAEDLDDALRAVQQITSLEAEDAAAIRRVIASWQDPQGVSNLLIHPALLPDDIRLSSLFRALAEHRVAYYILAATVGFQTMDSVSMVAAERKRVVQELLELIRDHHGIVAQRASISIQRFLTPEDAPPVFALWAHRDDTVWHNLRAWLYRTFLPFGIEPFAAAARSSGLAEEVQRRLLEDFTELAGNPAAECDSWLGELFSYIPNLRDVRPSAEST